MNNQQRQRYFLVFLLGILIGLLIRMPPDNFIFKSQPILYKELPYEEPISGIHFLGWGGLDVFPKPLRFCDESQNIFVVAKDHRKWLDGEYPTLFESHNATLAIQWAMNNTPANITGGSHS